MSAVPLVQDDRFWPDNPGCPLYNPEQWRREVDGYLDERDVISERAEGRPLVPAVGRRYIRRRIMGLRIRGVRPTDPVELKTTKWYRRGKKKRQPMLKCTATLPVLTCDGKLEMRTRRRRFAPAPNRRLTLVPSIEEHGLKNEPSEEPVAVATTETLEDPPTFAESEVILERRAELGGPMALVIFLNNGTPIAAETNDDPDPEILEIFKEHAIRSEIIALRATTSLPRHHLRRLLSRPAEDDFDPTTRDWLEGDPRYLRAR